MIVTYARPSVLEAMLRALSIQTRPPEHVVVVDNDSDPTVEEVAIRMGADYLDSKGNIGPAGGNALGTDWVLERAPDSDWILFIDDDNPPANDSMLERLASFGAVLASTDPYLGGVAVGGSRFRRQLGIFRRLADDDLHGAVELDVLFGGFLPLYRVHAVRHAGSFDPLLFWGFEEGDLGLRMRRHGYRMYAPGDAFLEARNHYLTKVQPKHLGRTSLDKAAWRRYYSVRNSTVVAQRYGGPLAPWFTGLGGATKGAVALIRTGRPFSEIVLPIKGALDAYRGRLGRTVDPGRNDKGSP